MTALNKPFKYVGGLSFEACSRGCRLEAVCLQSQASFSRRMALGCTLHPRASGTRQLTVAPAPCAPLPSAPLPTAPALCILCTPAMPHICPPCPVPRAPCPVPHAPPRDLAWSPLPLALRCALLAVPMFRASAKYMFCFQELSSHECTGCRFGRLGNIPMGEQDNALCRNMLCYGAIERGKEYLRRLQFCRDSKFD